MIASRPRIAGELIRGKLTDGEIVISLRGGERALILNELGDTVLDLCDGSRTVSDIVAFLRENLSVPPGADVGRDVEAVLEGLLQAGVIEAAE